MPNSETGPQSCWECDRATYFGLPSGGQFVDCPTANWKDHDCVSKLLETIENPFWRFRPQF